MSTEDRPNPQPDPEATMLVLNPGGRRPGASAAAVPAQPAPADSATPVHAVLPGSGLNPLVRAANPLLDLVVPLRHTVQPPELGALRERLALAIRNFETEARESGVPVESVAAARYALCTLLDEAISGTAWGSGVWGSRSLLVAFHNEASGGEKFFLVLQRLSEDPARHLDLLELMYLCLALGLEGRFRLAEQGQASLAALRERLLQLIRRHRGPVETDLSPHWRGQELRAASPLRRTPVWVLAATGCVLLVIAQLVASHFLNRASDPVFAGLSALRQEGVPARLAAPAPSSPSRTAGFLAPEVAQGLVTVTDTAGRTTITIRGEGMFPAGSAEVNPGLNGLLGKIGEALSTLPGKVIVIGHTDNTRPGLSARYPSNYELSKARAHSVMQALVQRAGPPARYSEEGRGDTEPLVPNDSPGARARNRRVDVVVLAPPTAS
jgi:type VI secretion system protein ImpK